MELFFSDVFTVEPDLLEEYGAFNISLINDLPLFVDPFLLFNSDKPAYQELHDEILRYLHFLKEMSEDGSIRAGLLSSWFLFPEVKQNWLGYSLVGNDGSGLGPDFAKALHRNLHTIFSNFGQEGITRSSHLEKLCLIKDGVGRDNISDFTTNLIKGFLLRYTQTFAQNHIDVGLRKRVTVDRVKFNYDTRSWERGTFDLPYYNSHYVILTPKDILTKDDTWINKSDLVSDFEDIAHAIPNAQLRDQVNEYFIRMLPRDPRKAPTKKDIREAVSHTVGNFPEFIDYYIRYKEDHGDEAKTISEQHVREVEFIFIRQLREFAETLLSLTDFYKTSGGTHEEARARVFFLKDVIENKGGHRLFYDAEERPIRRESDLQILFRLTWIGTSSDISREVNDGRGPVDFKISQGRWDKSLVEFKLAKNTHLKQNLEKQVAIYEKASDAPKSLRVIIYFTNDELYRVQKILKELSLESSPDVILIDARSTNKPSGSKAK
jgi:hypothetical protein